MEPNRKRGTLGRAVAKLKESAGRLLGGRRTTAAAGRREQALKRELRETYDNPTDANRARSAFRQ